MKKGVYSLTHLKEKDSIPFLLSTGTGILFSMVASSHFILNFLVRYYENTILFFVGLLLGGISFVPITKKNFMFTFCSFCFLFFLMFLPHSTFHPHFFSFFFVGIIESSTIIIPGISGTAVLMMLGCYESVIKAISQFSFPVLFPFFLGIAFGSFAFLKFVNQLISHFKEETHSIIFGFSLASICLMIKSLFPISLTYYTWIFLLTGFLLSYFLEKSAS